MHASMLMMFEYALLLIIGVCLEKRKEKKVLSICVKL